MFGNSDNNRSQVQGGHREVLSAKEGGGKGTAVGTRTGSEAAMRAMSVLENAKSNCHRKTHRVEPDGTGREFTRLTRGGLTCESAPGVSRSRSSEDVRGNPGRAKGRRIMKRQKGIDEPRSRSKRAGIGRNPISRFGRRANRGGPPESKPWTGKVNQTRQCLRFVVQPPDAENRTSGGVGALTGAIPSGPSDLGSSAIQAAERLFLGPMDWSPPTKGGTDRS